MKSKNRITRVPGIGERKGGGGGDPSSNQLLERQKNCTITYIKLLQNQKEQIINKSNLLLHYSRDLATNLKLKKETTTKSLKNNPKQILLGASSSFTITMIL